MAQENYKIIENTPFGITIINLNPQATLEDFSQNDIEQLLLKYKLIVFKGFKTLPKQELALYAQQLGEPLQWIFGAINELKVKSDIKNYIYTDRNVPLHWDGAFVGKIPFIILFQCLVAPQKEDMGGTTFTDSKQILQDLDKDILAAWEKISITYKTEKIAHYGGKITQSLISSHPITGEKVLRYAEPVEDINPVSLEINGLEEITQELFINKMQSLLYDEQYHYVHRWEQGDIVMADNHALLHGREAFKNPNERYIQRINILNRPKKPSLARFIKNSLTIRRKEFFIAELPIFLIAVFLSASTWNIFIEPIFYLGLLALFMLFNIGDMINCYADYKVDAVYKSHLSNAVFELGKKNIKLQMIISALIAFSIIICISISTKQYYLIGLVILGTFIGLQYSLPPFHFKSKGILQLICLWGIIFFGPMLLTAILTNGFPQLIHIFIFVCYGFHQMGIILLNTAEDYSEDKTAALNTIIVKLGLHKSMKFALWLVTLSGICLQIGFVLLFIKSTLPFYFITSVLIFSMGWTIIIFEFKKIINAIAFKNEEEAEKELKKNGMKVPRWLNIGAYTSLAICLVLFIGKLLLKV